MQPYKHCQCCLSRLDQVVRRGCYIMKQVWLQLLGPSHFAQALPAPPPNCAFEVSLPHLKKALYVWKAQAL